MFNIQFPQCRWIRFLPSLWEHLALTMLKNLLWVNIYLYDILDQWGPARELVGLLAHTLLAVDFFAPAQGGLQYTVANEKLCTTEDNNNTQGNVFNRRAYVKQEDDVHL